MNPLFILKLTASFSSDDSDIDEDSLSLGENALFFLEDYEYDDTLGECFYDADLFNEGYFESSLAKLPSFV